MELDHDESPLPDPTTNVSESPQKHSAGGLVVQMPTPGPQPTHTASTTTRRARRAQRKYQAALEQFESALGWKMEYDEMLCRISGLRDHTAIDHPAHHQELAYEAAEGLLEVRKYVFD
jgi:hypothetical protein